MTRERRRIGRVASTSVTASVLAAQVLVSTCSPYYPVTFGPTSPSPTPPQLVVIAITANGLDPAAFEGPRATIEFVNRDTVAHNIRSNPHPGHTDCTELNLEPIAPGERVAILNPFNSARFCGYHDETRLGDARFQGSISIR